MPAHQHRAARKLHTMSSIPGRDLTFRHEQSLSSRAACTPNRGARPGNRWGQLNIPVMSVNAIVQMLIPPPKHRIDKLMSVAIEPTAPIGHVFIMERGEELVERLTADEAIPTLIENTDDAYGFPPFTTFAPHLRIAGDGYLELRRKEEELLRRSLAGAVLLSGACPGARLGGGAARPDGTRLGGCPPMADVDPHRNRRRTGGRATRSRGELAARRSWTS